jgi:hypothetical protein
VGSGGNQNSTSIFSTTATSSLKGFKGLPSSFVGSSFNIESFGGGPGFIVTTFPDSAGQALSEKIANAGGAGFGWNGGSFPGLYPAVTGGVGTVFNGGDYLGSRSAPTPTNRGAGSGASTSGSGATQSTFTNTQIGANGIAGVSVPITGTSIIYGGSGAGARSAGGGNGGGGGSGGRGGTSGTPNTGGGGGGSLENIFGTPDAGNGGSGIVIIRYKYK